MAQKYFLSLCLNVPTTPCACGALCLFILAILNPLSKWVQWLFSLHLALLPFFFPVLFLSFLLPFFFSRISHFCFFCEPGASRLLFLLITTMRMMSLMMKPWAWAAENKSSPPLLSFFLSFLNTFLRHPHPNGKLQHLGVKRAKTFEHSTKKKKVNRAPKERPDPPPPPSKVEPSCTNSPHSASSPLVEIWRAHS